MYCPELYTEIKPLKDPQPTGPRGHDDEDDSLCVSSHMPSTDAFRCHQSLQAADITVQRSAVIAAAAFASSGVLART